jgi:hypothetical protein
MKTALYLPKEIFQHSSLVAELVAGNFNIDIDEEISKCLCEIQDNNGLYKYKRVITHPHRKETCWRKVRRIIEYNPLINFYVFALMAPERIKIIGNHPNLKYITEQDSKNGWIKRFEQMKGP